MNIFYDTQKKIWLSPHQLTFGSNKQQLFPLEKKEEHYQKFFVLQKKNHVGPLIGIMVAYNRKMKLIGNGELFINLQKQLDKYGGIITVFAPEDLKEQEVHGYTYLTAQHKWMPITTPLPHVVYNRVPFRKKETETLFLKARKFFDQKNIPFFNPGFIDKLQLFELFKSHSTISPFLPTTMEITSKHKLEEFLRSFPFIYIKPASGYKGQNIVKLSKLDDEAFLIEKIDETITFSSFSKVWEHFSSEWATTSYIAQEGIDGALYKGHRYDFRIIVTYLNGTYQNAGIGVRQSYKQEITTHLPNGGILIPYSLLQTPEHDQFIATLVKYCGPVLTEAYGFFGEFSIDATVDKQGNYYLIEINAKPMVFDETEMEDNRCTQLVKLFLELSSFLGYT